MWCRISWRIRNTIVFRLLILLHWFSVDWWVYAVCSNWSEAVILSQETKGVYRNKAKMKFTGGIVNFGIYPVLAKLSSALPKLCNFCSVEIIEKERQILFMGLFLI